MQILPSLRFLSSTNPVPSTTSLADYVSSVSQQLTQLLLADPNPQVVLPAIAHLLGDLFAVDGCILTTDLVGVEAQQVVWRPGLPTSVAPASRHDLHHPLAQLSLKNTSPLVIADTQAMEPYPLLQTEEQLPIRAVLGMGTQFQGQANGLIALVRSQPHQWSPVEIDLLQQIAGSVAIAFSLVFQTKQVHYFQEQALVADQRQSVLKDLTLAVRNGADLTHIFTLAVQKTAQLLQVDRGLVLLLKYPDPLPQRLKQRTSSDALEVGKARATLAYDWVQPQFKGEAAGAHPSSAFWLSECCLLERTIAQAPHPFAIQSLIGSMAEQLLMPTGDTLLGLAPIFNPDQFPAVLIAPLENQGALLGFLVLQHSHPRQWQPAESELLELVGAQVSTAILQTQTLRQVQALVEERTAQLQRSLEVQAKLYETTRKQIDQLRHLNQLKDEFVSTLSHELLTPLTSMTLAIRMLRQINLSPERQTRYLDILEKQCSQEIALINDLLDLQKLETRSATIDLQKVDLKRLVTDVIQSLEEKWAKKSLSWSLDLPSQALTLQTDRDSIQRVLLELMTNAYKYSAPHTTIHLQITSAKAGSSNQIVLKLTNQGAGIDPADLPHIFNKFRRGQGATQQAVPGTGLGLALVKHLVDHLQGTVAVTSTPLSQDSIHEVTLTLTLPQTPTITIQ